MASIDFTLEDIKQIVNTSVEASELRLTKHLVSHIDKRSEETHQAVVDLVSTILDQLDEHTARFDQMDQRFDVLDKEIKITGRLVRKHSADIMELRAAS